MFKKSFFILMIVGAFNFCSAMLESLGTPPEEVSLLHGEIVFSRVFLEQISDFFRARGVGDCAQITECIEQLADGDQDCDSSFIYMLHSGNRVFSDRHDLVFVKIKIKEQQDDTFKIWCPYCFVGYVHSLQPLQAIKFCSKNLVTIVFNNFSTSRYKSDIPLLIRDFLADCLSKIIVNFKLLDARNFAHPYNKDIFQRFMESGVIVPVIIAGCLHCLSAEKLLEDKIIGNHWDVKNSFKCPICSSVSFDLIGSGAISQINPESFEILQHKIPMPLGLSHKS